MNKRSLLARTAVGAVGGMLLIGAAGAAVADEVANDDVNINVNIEAIEPVGALTMTVASNATSLTEVDSGDEAIRQFDGTLPTVTVSDDREDVPEDSLWYVNGQASAFAGPNGASLPAEHLGWTPSLLTQEDGAVAEGPNVGTILDTPPNNVGLVGEELLALALDSGEARVVGTWEATAGLTLKTPVNVTPGSYTSVLTLTLWEDTY